MWRAKKDFLWISKTIRELPKVFPEREERDLEDLALQIMNLEVRLKKDMRCLVCVS